ncbi:phage tail protein [Yersinia kristensenii]|uniref:phage tail protein n=1 Tax=Yersinia kristensenii TaxID=28152 RepID=UPI001C60B7F9|nr:phage tail protein [Yersinia kristensenii]MBW5826015.1 phage tail protein [Yersinia kristensenii]
MTTKFFAVLTNLGAARLANATALGTRLEITHMAVGDGGGVLPIPNAAQTQLIGEKRRAALNSLSVDAANSNQIIAEQVIPENEGGWWIREIGLFDKDGVLIAIANCPETYKPQLQEGSGRTQTVRVVLIVSSTEAVTLKIDPSVVLATRKYVDDKVIEVKAYADGLMAAHLAAADPHSQYAPKASPALTGKPTAPTPVKADNSTQLANTAFVQAAIAALIASSPTTLDTLKKLADALGSDPSFATTMANALTTKMDKAKNGSDIQNVTQFLTNLGLKGAAKRDVGTGGNQIPDMSSFEGARGVSWMKKHPSGLIEVGGSFGVSGSTSVQSITVNYPVPFPAYCTGIWFSFQTADPTARFCGVFDKTSSLTSFIASVMTPSVNTIYYRAVGY